MITSFTNEYDFLSNFYMDPVQYDGVTYKSVEHGYQAAKALTACSISPSYLELFTEIKNAPMAAKAKKLGQKVPLHPFWKHYKVLAMDNLLRAKFQKEPLRTKLLNTEYHTLVEGNTWGDTFWGICNGHGQNKLGELLMRIREDIHKGTLQ